MSQPYPNAVAQNMSLADCIREMLARPENKWNPYSDIPTDFVTTWFREDPYAQVIIRYVIQTRLPARIAEMKAYVGKDLAKWTGWEWKDSEYVHLFICKIARQVEIVVNGDEEGYDSSDDPRDNDDDQINSNSDSLAHKDMSGTIYVNIGNNSWEYIYSDVPTFINACEKATRNLEAVVDRAFKLNVHSKEDYIQSLKTCVGIKDGQIDNPNLEYVRSLVNLIDEPTTF